VTPGAQPSWQPPPPQPGPAPGVAFAPHGVRLLAYLIDGLIISIPFFVIFLAAAPNLLSFADFRELTPDSFEDGAVVTRMFSVWFGFFVPFLILGLIAWLYFPICWTLGGQTLGMKPFHLYVVRDADGGPVTIGRALLRLLGYWISAAVFYLGFIWILIDDRRRGWHDLIAGTCVIERK